MSGFDVLGILGNIIWLLLAGFWLAIGYIIAGIVAFVFILTIPFGLQAFKLAGFALWPFGRAIVFRPERDVAVSLVGNVIWFVIAGFWLALGHVLAALLLFITIIGIPFGVANLKLAGLALAPFGKTIVPLREAGADALVVVRPLGESER